MNGQIKNSFDAITKTKIFKSFLLACAGVAFIGLVELVQVITKINLNYAIVAIVGVLIPFIVNTAIQYIKGK